MEREKCLKRAMNVSGAKCECQWAGKGEKTLCVEGWPPRVGDISLEAIMIRKNQPQKEWRKRPFRQDRFCRVWTPENSTDGSGVRGEEFTLAHQSSCWHTECQSVKKAGPGMQGLDVHGILGFQSRLCHLLAVLRFNFSTAKAVKDCCWWLHMEITTKTTWLKMS